MTQGKLHKNKVILMYGRFPLFFEDGVRPLDVPSCNPGNASNWMGWTKKELEKKEYDVYAPQVPKVWESPYTEWKKVLDEIGVDENTTLVGLSAGAAAVSRYIVEGNNHIKKLILIAPARFATTGDPCPTRDEYYNFEIDKTVQKQITNGVTIFFDPQDYPPIVKSVEMYKQEFEAKTVPTEGCGHFSFLIPTFPPLLNEILTNNDE